MRVSSFKRKNLMSNEFSENDWRRFLISLGEDPNRSGLRETPARVAKAWKFWT
jgi:GTP cyclohydrolase I